MVDGDAFQKVCTIIDHHAISYPFTKLVFSEQAGRFILRSDCDSNKMISNPLLPLQVLVPPSESTVTTAEKYEVPWRYDFLLPL